jgi:hypothetical protein
MPVTTFDPAENGFAYGNSWALSPAERDELRAKLDAAVSTALRTLTAPIPGAFWLMRFAPRLASLIAAGAPDGYGLCGGMAFAALDYWHEGGVEAVATRFPARPAPGSPEHAYLWRRLIESLVANGHVFIAWMAVLHLVPEQPPFNGGAPWLLRRSRAEWKKLRDHINAEQPVPIGLIGSTRDPFLDHQVLAYGYEESGPETGRIHVYDMNCPGTGRTIDIDLRGPVLKADEECRSTARGDLRAFFCEEYRRATPPA